MKKNLYYLRLMLGLVFGMMTFTACGGGDDDNGGNDSGQTSGGDITPQEDYGTDGLKGYWIQNEWDDTCLESYTMYNILYDTNIPDIDGECSILISLDGEGGGTIYKKVTTLDHAANNTKYLMEKVGTFFDTVDGSTKDYHFYKTFTHWGPNNTETLYSNFSSPLEYFIKGTTMTIYYDNVSQTMQLNVSSGYVTGYHRLKKVE